MIFFILSSSYSQMFDHPCSSSRAEIVAEFVVEVLLAIKILDDFTS